MTIKNRKNLLLTVGFGMICHPAKVVGSSTCGPPASGTVIRTKSMGGFYRSELSPCMLDLPVQLPFYQSFCIVIIVFSRYHPNLSSFWQVRVQRGLELVLLAPALSALRDGFRVGRVRRQRHPCSEQGKQHRIKTLVNGGVKVCPS